MRFAALISTCLLLTIAGCYTHEPFQFVVVGDTRADEPVTQPESFRTIIEMINAMDPAPAFVIDVGDLILGYTDDHALIVEEWDEFDSVVNKLDDAIPFHTVVGNHDAWDDHSHAYYKDRYGPTYYSFNHNGSHFVVLSSEERDNQLSLVTGEQLEWLAEDLRTHQDAAHTFTFLHKPLWATHRGLGQSNWHDDVHPLLAKNDVDIVFAGHDHEFVNYGVVDGVQYYVTGGGGAGLSSGAFHHFMVIDVKGRKVGRTVIDLEGRELPDDVVTVETKLAWIKLDQSLVFAGVDLPEDSRSITIENAIENPFDEPLEIRFAWDVADTDWSVTPEQGSLRIAPQKTASLNIVGTFNPDRPIPVPVMNSTILLGGQEITQIESSFQPLIRQQADAAPVSVAPTVDGTIAEGEYGSARFNSGFVDYKGRGIPAHGTKFLLAYDDKALYVAVVAEESETEAITVEPRQRDGDLWKDDSVELFIDATFDRSTYNQFATNIDGAQLDSIGGPEHGQFGDLAWNVDWSVATKVAGYNYFVEFAIPFESLGVSPPKPGTQWGLNICRSRQVEGKSTNILEMGAWSIPYANFHVPTHFGIVTFK